MLPLERTSPGGYLQWNLVQLNWSSYHPLLERGFLLRDFAPKQFLVQHFFRFFVFFCCFVFLARFDHFTLPSVSDSFSSTHFAPKCHFCTVLHCFALFAIFFFAILRALLVGQTMKPWAECTLCGETIQKQSKRPNFSTFSRAVTIEYERCATSRFSEELIKRM